MHNSILSVTASLKKSSQCAVILFVSICIFLVSCNYKSNDSSKEGKSNSDDKYEDGTYCAAVRYYNPNTGTNRTYTLNVEVESNELTKIYWTNGGWLDNSHFRPPEIDTEGACSFTSDKGYQYSIQITGPECSLSSTSIILEGNDESKEFTLTIEQCASTMSMTEKELLEYEANFKVSRKDIMTEKMCNKMFEYIQSHRELTREKDALNELIDNGYIQKKYSVGEEGNIECQTIIVKRKGYYYLLEVQGRRNTTMGLMDFEPSISGWQDVKILEDPSKLVWQVFTMRVIDKNSEMYPLANEMKTLCDN